MMVSVIIESVTKRAARCNCSNCLVNQIYITLDIFFLFYEIVYTHVEDDVAVFLWLKL